MTILYTIGHSNRTLEEFLELVHAHELNQIIDIRSIPKSRLFPWFNKEALSKTFTKSKIVYHHVPQLGGRRHTSKASKNNGWVNASFRGFADYMQTKDFFLGLKILNQFLKSRHKKTAIMCAEAVPWRCHRSLIADAELVRGIKVIDILTKSIVKKHQLTSFAVVDKSVRPIQIFYPSANLDLSLDRQCSIKLRRST